MRTFWMLTLLVGGEAHAGSGPWVLGKGDQQIYVGLDAQRFSKLAVDSGAYTEDVIDVDQGVSTFGAKLIGGFGLGRAFEVEFELPYVYTFAHRQGAVCDLLGQDACATTQGLGIVAARMKYLAVDEVLGKPLSVALGLDLRFGQATGAHRERITSLGEGTFDVEPRLSLGRIGSLPSGYWSLYADGSFRFRFPMTTDVAGTGRWAPGFEITATLENLYTPGDKVSFGPAFSLLSRPLGVDFSGTDLADVDRLTALRIFALEGGLKLIVRNGRNVSVSLAAFHTIYAVNNPQNVFKVAAGVAFRDVFRRREP
ncbi:MAG: hypothetical protein H6733_05145 [Alphaproteobacteria bacterium]|nr:hypothetical protein [Alphaproteobacteria bacterium]